MCLSLEAKLPTKNLGSLYDDPRFFEPLSTFSITPYPLSDSLTSGRISRTCFVCGFDGSGLKASTPEPGKIGVNSYLPRIVAPTLIIAPEKDVQALTMYRTSISAIASDTNLDIVTQARKRGLANILQTIPGVQNAFENTQSLHKVGEFTIGWFTHLL